jgi:hypothetical protein
MTHYEFTDDAGVADDNVVTVRVPRDTFVLMTPRPSTVTKDTVVAHFGMTPSMFMRLARDGVFPTKRIGRTVFAAYDDVKRVLVADAATREQFLRSFKTVDETPNELSLKAAIAYLDGARTRDERRKRSAEVSSKAWVIVRRYNEKLADGSPNPDYDKERLGRGLDLVLASSGLRPSPRGWESASRPRSEQAKK